MNAADTPYVPPNAIDRAISYFAPRYALKRAAARQTMAFAGGYSGARIDKASLATWITRRGGSAVAEVVRDLPVLRARSRDLERNSPVATSAIGTTVTHVVGTGLACTPKVDAAFLGLTEQQKTKWEADVKTRFNAWAESSDCDLARKLNFYGIQDVALRGVLASGDLFVNTPRVARESGITRLALQLIEADLCSNPDRKPGTATLTDGVRHDATTGEALGYFFSSRHPAEAGFQTAPVTWDYVPARGAQTGRRNVLHLFRQIRPGLRRGVPILAPVIEPLKQLERYTNAELAAAVVSGLYALFVKMDADAFKDAFDEESRKLIVDRGTQWSGEVEPGQAVNLLPGEDVVSANPGRPNAQFDPFVTSCMRQIGMAIGMPYEVLVMHYQSSYSAARGALLMAWRFFNSWRDWLATELCQPVYELWLADEVAAGRIAAAGFFANPVRRHAWTRCAWVGDGPGSIDPNKEVLAAHDRVKLGISTLEAESLLHDGIGWEVKHEQQVREAKARREADLYIANGAPAAPAASVSADDLADPEDGGDATAPKKDEPTPAIPSGAPAAPAAPRPAPRPAPAPRAEEPTA